MNNLESALKNTIRKVPNFPKQGILFWDITTLLNTKYFKRVIDFLECRYANYELDFIAGVESRGFIFGSALACALDIGFVPIRKSGKLPSKTFKQSYDLEYGSDSLEIHEDAFLGGGKVLLIDDLIAIGGSAKASENLIKQANGELVESCFIIEIQDLEGVKKLSSSYFSLLKI